MAEHFDFLIFRLRCVLNVANHYFRSHQMAGFHVPVVVAIELMAGHNWDTHSRFRVLVNDPVKGRCSMFS